MKPANANEPQQERHYIMVDGETYKRIEAAAIKKGLDVQAIVDHAINRTLDAIYLGRARAS